MAAPKRRKLKVDLDEIIIAMETPRNTEELGIEWYFDVQTGETVMVGEDLENEVDVHADPRRYLIIPETAPRQEYERMVAFTEDVDDAELREELYIALDGKGAFGRFRGILNGYPSLRGLWYAQLRETRVEQAVAWLRSQQIEPEYEVRKAGAEAPAVSAAARVGAEVSGVPKVTPSKAGAQGLPYIGLLEILLLGATEAEPVKGRAFRRINTKSSAQARWVFKNVARDLCTFYGATWRNRFIKDTNLFAMAEVEVEVDGNSVSISMPATRRLREAFLR